VSSKPWEDHALFQRVHETNANAIDDSKCTTPIDSGNVWKAPDVSESDRAANSRLYKSAS